MEKLSALGKSVVVCWAFGVSAGCVPNAADREVVQSPPVDESGDGQIEVSSARCAVVPISEEEAAVHRTYAVHGAAAAPPLVVFLNKNGGTYSPGANNSATNRSSIVSRTYTLPAFSRGDARWSALVECVRDQFARFNITITEVEPAAGSYIEAVVSGHPSQIGLSGGIGGIAPLDSYNCRPIERAIAYVFERNLGNDQNLCEVTAHEIGHTLSLEHEYKCEDPMTYLYGCGDKTFQDVTASCGTYRAERCACRGGTQNTVQALLQLVGPSTGGGGGPDPAEDMSPPLVELVSPSDGISLRENSTIEVVATASDDQFLARTELVWDFNGQTYGCPLDSQYVDCTQSGDTFTWTIRVGTGRRSFHVRALDLAGKEAVTETRGFELTADGNPPVMPPADGAAPEIVVVGPSDGTIAAPSSTVEIVAEISDDVRVAGAELVWEFNGQNYPCPTSQSYVTCTVSGSTYTWSVRVGVEGSRVFSVRAVDSSGRESLSDKRAVQVRVASDAAAPAVALVEPTSGMTLPARSEIKVVADISDDVAVQEASLIWDFNGQTYPCPHASTYVDCAVENGRYTWLVRAGTGARTFRVRASDAAGNETTSEDRAIALE